MRRLPPRTLDLLLLGPAALLAGLVAWAWARRLTWPYDLEWMEGGMLAHGWRLLHGQPIYPAASPEWLSYVYPPGYTALLAALGSVYGLDYPVGRAISIAGTLLAAAACARLVQRVGGLALGLASAAVFLGCYEASGAFYDLVRPDALAMGLLGWAIAAGLERSRRAPEAAGLLLALAFTVKHHSAAYGLPMVLGIWARDGWRPAARFGAASAIPAGLFTVALQIGTHGNFLKWLLAVPASHPLAGNRFFPGGPIEAGLWLLTACAASAAYLWLRAGRLGEILGVVCGVFLAGAAWSLPRPMGLFAAGPLASALCAGAIGVGGGALLGRLIRDGRAPSWGWVYGGGIGLVAWVTTGLMRAHNGGFINVLMPLHWTCAVAIGVVVARARRRWPGTASDVAGTAVMAVQLGWMLSISQLERLIPDPSGLAAGDAVVAQIREVCPPGPILSPFASWLPVRAGREPSWHLIAMWDIAHRTGPYFDVVAQIGEAAQRHEWACVIDGGSGQLGGGIERAYPRAVRVRVPPRALQPTTGWRVRPVAILLPPEEE